VEQRVITQNVLKIYIFKESFSPIQCIQIDYSFQIGFQIKYNSSLKLEQDIAMVLEAKIDDIFIFDDETN
jgi:hypothetical protein